MIEKNISNRYLNESKIIKAKNDDELEMKIKKQKQQWKEKEKLLRLKEEAQINTKNALATIEEYNLILQHSLNLNHIIEWGNLYDIKDFSLDQPKLETYTKEIPEEKVFTEFFFSSFKREREEKQQVAERLYQDACTNYVLKKERFYHEQKEKQQEVDSFRKTFEEGEKETIERYFTTVLNNSPYPQGIIKNFTLGYDMDTRNLIIEYAIPHLDGIPNILEYKFIQAKKEINTKIMKKDEFQIFYDDILYKITLRTIYECFSSDYPNHLESMVFNGWVHGIDNATGREFDSRIISILVKKTEFMALNLQRVVAKDCFRKLNGQSSGSLHNLAPIRPILELNRIDERFIETRDILAEINSIPNLAEMEWEDFEHLVVNLFSHYFEEIGEVKITRKSREGGIDGVIFDDDPIRGGKYIIQAKKYNDIVSPSAVRELSGTMHHEKATRGILITTGYFGPDSHTFAKDNNITLIDGNRLVYMLNSYGYTVRCEIKKGKK